MTNEKIIKSRYLIVDFIRGVAIYLMVFFHFFYDLRAFGYNQIDFHRDFFWWFLPRIIVFLFLLCVGFSLCIVHLPHVRWKVFWQRFAKIALSAVCISIFTFFAFPKNWIYFGTLHCIAVCSLLALPFLRYPNLSLLISLILGISWIGFKVEFPWIKLSHYSMDYIPSIPWLFVVLLGIFCFHKNLHKLPFPKGQWANFIIIPGKHALKIYLLHQPILYSFVYLFHKLTH